MIENTNEQYCAKPIAINSGGDPLPVSYVILVVKLSFQFEIEYHCKKLSKQQQDMSCVNQLNIDIVKPKRSTAAK